MNTETEETAAEAKPQMDIAQQLQKIQQHLVFLEKKIDMLVSQAQQSGGGAPFRGNRDRDDRGNFSRPRRDFNSSGPSRGYHKPGGYQGGFRQDRGPGQRQDRRFDKPRQHDNRGGGFFHKKKNFSPRPQRDSGPSEF